MRNNLVLTMTLVLFVGFLFLATRSLGLLSTSTNVFLPRSDLSPNLTTSTSRVYSSRLSSWSKIAEPDTDFGSFRLVNTEDAEALAASQEGIEFSDSLVFNLASPREWLEFCEARQLYQDQHPNDIRDRAPGCGAYTVLRCDFLLEEKAWRIWGRDFHWNRLRESYRLLLQQKQSIAGNNGLGANHCEQAAIDSSIEAMDCLLAEAESEILSKYQRENDETAVVVAMLTLLWDPEPGDATSIRVRGHGFSTMKPSHNNDTDGTSMGNPNAPIEAVIGFLPVTLAERVADRINNNHHDVTMLPNRYQNTPQAKLSSWCRRRRLLEKIFKGENTGDVILTKECGLGKETETNKQESSPEAEVPSIEMLEGLTSNMFVLYPGNVLRTAHSSHVLGGYVRDLIVECASECGYRVKFGPIPLVDSSKWKEVFLTSSVRLVIPVSRILLPSIASSTRDEECGDSDDLFRLDTVWEMARDDELSDGDRPTRPASHVLYEKLMERGRDIPSHTSRSP